MNPKNLIFGFKEGLYLIDGKDSFNKKTYAKNSKIFTSFLKNYISSITHIIRC
ncbi:MAG: hypothetical protein ACJAWW_002408 [Sulfurimonas sp.]|jgi:hypothetical protein